MSECVECVKKFFHNGESFEFKRKEREREELKIAASRFYGSPESSKFPLQILNK